MKPSHFCYLLLAIACCATIAAQQSLPTTAISGRYGSQVYVSSPLAKLRQQPGQETPQDQPLAYGVSLTRIKTEGQWHYVNVKTQQGWVHKSLVSNRPPAEDPSLRPQRRWQSFSEQELADFWKKHPECQAYRRFLDYHRAWVMTAPYTAKVNAITTPSCEQTSITPEQLQKFMRQGKFGK